MPVSNDLKELTAGASFIRRMFEEGRQLKEKYGAERVFDFTIGSPSVPPPARFTQAVIEIMQQDIPGKHGYMPNAGYPHVREAVARRVSREQEVTLQGRHIVMTCGAAGGFNVLLKTLLNRGDSVLTPIPYFVEYKFYAANHGGSIRYVPCQKNFDLDLDAIAAHIDETTAAIVICSPNNPSGVIYSRSTLQALSTLLGDKSREIGREIYLISDEPYRKIVFNGHEVPALFPLYAHSAIVTSCSKDLSLPGERIGWVALNPQAADAQSILDGMILCNRILGFINAPALMQRALAEVIDEQADLSAYERRKNLLCRGLEKLGYRFVEPQGTFYLLAEAPGGDDLAFVDALKEELVLAVPGRGFGIEGYFRLAFCIEDKIIEQAMPRFEKVMQRFS